MIIKPICSKCLKIAFSYYVGNDVDLEKQDIKFFKPMACIHCGHKMSKISKSAGILKREEDEK